MGDSGVSAAAYTHLQQIVGVIALLLPFVLIIGNRLLSGDELESSISAYYHTPMGDVFVGALCAVPVFFLSYNFPSSPGFNLDNKLSTLATVAAVWASPSSRPRVTRPSPHRASRSWDAVAPHVRGPAVRPARCLRGLLPFPRSAGAKTAVQKQRNIVYRACGLLIVAAMVMNPVSNWLDPPDWLHAFFWLETICAAAFGISWLVKGGFLGILADKSPTPVPAAP